MTDSTVRTTDPPVSPTDAEGPRGTNGCACVADNAQVCYLRRHNIALDSVEVALGEVDEVCECLCHNWQNDWEEPDDTPYCECGAVHSDNEQAFHRCDACGKIV